MNITPEMAQAELARRAALQNSNVQTTKDDSSNLLQKIIRYGIKDPIIGVANAGHNIENALSNVSSTLFPKESDIDYSKTLGINDKNSADELAQGIGQYGPSVLVPEANLGKVGQLVKSIPKADSLLSKILGEGISQGAYSAIQNPEDRVGSGIESGIATSPFTIASEAIGSSNPLAKFIARAAVGAGTGALTGEALKQAGMGNYESILGGALAGIGGAKAINKKAFLENLTKGVDPDVAAERLDAAKKLGLTYLTPAEAGLSPMAARAQGALGRGTNAQLLYQKGLGRIDSEKNAINDLLTKIYDPESMGPQISKLYQDSAQTVVPAEVMDKFSDNAIVNKAKDSIDKSPAFQESLKNVPKDSLGYWDLVKQAIGDLEESAPSNEARIIGQTRRDLTSNLDDLSPDYQAARRLYERKATRMGLEKVFDRKEVNGKNFYQALASQNKFDDLLSHLNQVPEAKDNLIAMRSIFKDLIGPPTISTAKGTEERGLFEHRNMGNLLQSVTDHLFSGGKNSEDAINFITSPDWHEQMKSIDAIPDKNLKAAAFITNFGRAASQTVPNVS